METVEASQVGPNKNLQILPDTCNDFKQAKHIPPAKLLHPGRFIKFKCPKG